MAKNTDENGERRRVAVQRETLSSETFEKDLSLLNEKLSREHLKIERFGDVFVAADCNSSNGTTLNGENLNARATLKNGDTLNLGGGLEIEVELVSDKFNSASASPAAFGGNLTVNETETPSFANISTASKSNSSADTGGIPMSFFYLAPLFGVGILLFLGAIVFVFSGGNKKVPAESENEIVYSSARKTRDKRRRNE